MTPRRAETLLFTGPDGTLGTKQRDLAAHGFGAVRFREHVPEELRVRRVGSDVAVAALRARLGGDGGRDAGARHLAVHAGMGARKRRAVARRRRARERDSRDGGNDV